MKEKIGTKIPAEIREQLAAEIVKNDGNEVYFHATCGDDGIISEVEAIAWGNEFAAPALTDRLEPGDVVLHNHPSGDLTPSLPDIQVASHLGNQGIGFYIINNAADTHKIVVDRYTTRQLEALDADEIIVELADESAIAQCLPEYESRPGQLDMAAEVVQCFNEGNIGLIEAGTGTGKTLAYILPAIRWALKNKERVLVSTNTINLQEQLLYKDLPLLKEALEDDFSAVLVKGRGNYVCLRRVDSEERDLGLFRDEKLSDDLDELKSIIAWSKKTKDGSLADLNYVPKGDIWDRVKCESETCTGVKCAFYEECFLVTARREAAQSDIMIVNHHLLFADLSIRGSAGSFADIAVLPPYTRVIIDEAHNIENVSTEFFGTTVSQFGIKRLLGRLYRHGKKGDPRGLLPIVRSKLKKITVQTALLEINAINGSIEDRLMPDKESLIETGDDLFLDISAFLLKKFKNSANDRQYRMDENFSMDEEWQNLILVKAEGFIFRLREFKSNLYSVIKDLKDLDDSVRRDIDSAIIELDALERRIGATADSMYYLLFEDDKAVVKWVSLTEKQKMVRVSAAPINVADPLNKTLFEPFDTVIMTSATLTVGGTFEFIRSRLGIDQLDRSRVKEQIFDSPFDFQTQALIGIPLNSHPPDHPMHTSTSHRFISRSVSTSSGRAFALFTSYYAMNEAHEAVTENSPDMSIRMLKQGTDTRHNLLDRFRHEQPAVLFATDSFWEGVDVIGDALESIIIARLPFKVPTVPIEVARREAIDAEGGNSFTDYTVPQAVIKFKQGFGRLIRHKNDRGTILILDNRIVSKQYGRVFLDSLPDCKVVADSDEVVFEQFEKFYNG